MNNPPDIQFLIKRLEPALYAAAGTCIGNVNIQIDAGTNEDAQIALEDHLNTPAGGSGVMVRTGSLDNRGKIDIYVDSISGKHDDTVR